MKKHSLLIPMSLLAIISSWGHLWAQENTDKPVVIDSNTIVVDLDQPAKYIYRQEILRKCEIGSKPGQIGLKRSADLSLEGPQWVAVDSSANIYVDDKVNHRIQKFDKNGRFKEIVYIYPKQTGIWGMAATSDGSIYVNIDSAPKSEETEIWAVSKGTILGKYSGGGISVLPDGNIWRLAGTSSIEYSSLDNKIQFTVDQATITIRWPWVNGGKITVSQSKHNEKSIQLSNDHLNRSIRLLSTSNNFTVVPALSTKNHVYFSIGVKPPQGFVLEVEIPNFRSRLITAPKRSLIVNQIATDGNLYGLEVGELGEALSNNFQCNVFRDVPVPARE